MTSSPLKFESVQGKVDFGVITIRTDEYEAVLKRLPHRRSVVGGNWLYEYASFRNRDGDPMRVAVARTLGQGQGEAQQTANELIADLRPKWIVLVGIAGGFPNDDFSLGDVVLASRVLDLSVTAAKQGGITEYVVRGGRCHPDVEVLLSWLPSQRQSLCGWSSPNNLINPKPSLTVPEDDSDDRLYGDDGHKQDVSKSLKLHFAAHREPCFAPAPLGTSNTLVKNVDIVRQFTNASRDIEHVEMEAGGVSLVCHRRNLPLLSIRGISDVVGFKRAPEWTLFACHSAASFFCALMTTIPRHAWGPSLGNVGSWITRLNLPVRLANTLRNWGTALRNGYVYTVGAFAGTNLPSLNKLRLRIGKHSDWLLRFRLPDERRINFEVEREIRSSLGEQKVTLLLGRPGSGKTCLLAKLGSDFANSGTAILAVKADMFPHDKSFDEWAKDELGYDLTFLDVVHAVASREKLVVLVDQLDALASTVDLTSNRLNEILTFVASCNELPNVHVISSCRDFDFSYDPRFKRLNATVCRLERPSWEQTADILRSGGIDPSTIPEKLQDVLRIPQHLAIFLKLQAAGGMKGGQHGQDV